MPSPRTVARERGWISRGWGIGLVVAFFALVGGCYALYHHGLGTIEEEVRRDLADNPIMRLHLGEIEDVSIDYEETGAVDRAEIGALAGEHVFAFQVRGSEGVGIVCAAIATCTDGYEHVMRGTLTLASGETLDLFPGVEDDPSSAD